jgi:uncharacterized damage-inducible protein DinB
MTPNNDSLMSVYEGWDGYQRSVAGAVAPLTQAQLAWRPREGMRSVRDVAAHMALGRIDWFLRMGAPGSEAAAARVPEWEHDPHGNRYSKASAIPAEATAVELVEWLDATWAMIERTLREWTVQDLKQTYRHVWRGDEYRISRQWTIWRIMAHDLHHGGELAALLGMQGVENFELGGLGGHVIEPEKIGPAPSMDRTDQP